MGRISGLTLQIPLARQRRRRWPSRSSQEQKAFMIDPEVRLPLEYSTPLNSSTDLHESNAPRDTNVELFRSVGPQKVRPCWGRRDGEDERMILINLTPLSCHSVQFNHVHVLQHPLRFLGCVEIALPRQIDLLSDQCRTCCTAWPGKH